MTNDATPVSCHDPPEVVKTPFLCAPYFAGEDGRYEPSRSIDRCPVAAAGERCQISMHGSRDRKTGPMIPLRVLHCKPHCRHFTVYPPGHVPYGRCSVAAVDLRGEPVQRPEPEPEASCRGCVFEAALDAAAGRLWEREPIEVDALGPRYPTQHRRLERCGKLLGLSPTLVRVTVEQIRDHLGLDALEHTLEQYRFKQAKGPKPRGEAILAAQQRLAPTGRVERLLAAGSLSGLWGHPWLWDASRARRLSLLDRTARALRAPP